MDIAGTIKNSFVDYPGKIAFVIFVKGCNLACWYCHNADILSKDTPVLNEKEIFEFLEKRKNYIDAVVFSGGEPTMYPDLKDKIVQVKKMGYLVKLDTNGTNPKALQQLLDEGLLDYIAMDVKAPMQKYQSCVCTNIDLQKIKKSITIIKDSNITYEFRTTFIPNLSIDDVILILKEIKGAEKYCLQQFVHSKTSGTIVPIKLTPHSGKVFAECKKIAEEFVGQCVVKGV